MQIHIEPRTCEINGESIRRTFVISRNPFGAVVSITGEVRVRASGTLG